MTTAQQIETIKNLIKPLIIKGTMSFRVYEFFGAIVASVNCPNHSVVIECRAYEKRYDDYDFKVVELKDSKNVWRPVQLEWGSERIFWQIILQAI
jgi:hypothetical protein